jgi:anhydro-N-acetylmuramic acid kinase
MKEKTRAEIVVPDRLLIDYKEALIFAFLGYLRLQGFLIMFPSCTGASRNQARSGLFTVRKDFGGCFWLLAFGYWLLAARG